MANEPSASGLIILTGITIAAVVGLFAYDIIPRRDGVAPTAQISWPRWQSDDSTPPPVQQTAQPPAPAYSEPQQPQQQPYPPAEQGYGPNQPPQQYPQNPRGQDVPYDQQGSPGGAGQPPPPDGSPRG